MSLINVTDLAVRYGPVTAVNGLSLHVNPGEVVGVLGGNGAGKSSTLRSVAGVNPPTSGTVTVAGFDMGDPRQVEAGRASLGYCPDVGGLLRQATVREHVALALAAHRQTRLWPQALELVERFDLLHAVDRVTAGFSHGMSRRLSVMLAVLTARQALILDEPFDGVDPLGVDVTLAAIRDARDAGLGVLVSTHLVSLLVAASDRVVVVVDGRVVDEAPAVEFGGEAGASRYQSLLEAAREDAAR